MGKMLGTSFTQELIDSVNYSESGTQLKAGGGHTQSEKAVSGYLLRRARKEFQGTSQSGVF